MNKELNGLNYDELVLNSNVHKIINKVTTINRNNHKETPIDDNAFWLVSGLGYLNKETPDSVLEESLKDIIIVSKSELIKFLKEKKNG